jgi:hypothetical protein
MGCAAPLFSKPVDKPLKTAVRVVFKSKISCGFLLSFYVLFAKFSSGVAFAKLYGLASPNLKTNSSLSLIRYPKHTRPVLEPP